MIFGPSDVNSGPKVAATKPILRESVNGVLGAASAVHFAPKVGNTSIFNANNGLEDDGWLTVCPVFAPHGDQR